MVCMDRLAQHKCRACSYVVCHQCFVEWQHNSPRCPQCRKLWRSPQQKSFEDVLQALYLLSLLVPVFYAEEWMYKRSAVFACFSFAVVTKGCDFFLFAFGLLFCVSVFGFFFYACIGLHDCSYVGYQALSFFVSSLLFIILRLVAFFCRTGRSDILLL